VVSSKKQDLPKRHTTISSSQYHVSFHYLGISSLKFSFFMSENPWVSELGRASPFVDYSSGA
jgi:hypothetical protein